MIVEIQTQSDNQPWGNDTKIYWNNLYRENGNWELDLDG